MSRIIHALSKCDKNAIDPGLLSLLDTPLDELPRETLQKHGNAPALAVVPEPVVPPEGAPVPPVAAAPEQPAVCAQAEPPLVLPIRPVAATARCCPMNLPTLSPLLPFGESDFAAGEQYRIARTKIVQHPMQPRLIVVSSPAPGDGKSITAVNLAAALSLKSERKVLLVDGDFRHSSIAPILGLPESPGLAEVLSGACTLEEALIQTEQYCNLCVLPAGEAVSNPTELFDSTNWVAVVSTIRKNFQYAIVDSPSIGILADYDLIQAQCDGVAIVLRPGHTDRKLAFKAIDSVPKEKLVGVVLNCVKEWILQRHTSSHYYSYRTVGR
jgi:protein-tyrosine kinase